MCALFYENRLGIKKIVISFVYLFCPNTGTKFREPYHSNHVIPHRDIYHGMTQRCLIFFLESSTALTRVNSATVI